MSKQKKNTENKFQTPAAVHHKEPGGRRGVGYENRSAVPVFWIVTAALLILFWLIWDYTGTTKVQPRAPANESIETPLVTVSTLDFTESPYGMEMTYVRGGTFLMGCTPEQGNDCYDYEDSLRMTTIGDFYIGKHEITQSQWEAVMGGNPSNFKGNNLPVENVSWIDAQEFIGKLNAATGREYRLPTEAEWEYAARGGRQTRGYKYSGSSDVGEVAWYEGNSENMTHPVGTKKANELGIYDMSGNVWEWVSDWFGEYESTAQTDPKGPDEGTLRVIRGGGWGSYARGVRLSNYFNNDPGYRYNILGFRLACDSTCNLPRIFHNDSTIEAQ